VATADTYSRIPVSFRAIQALAARASLTTCGAHQAISQVSDSTSISESLAAATRGHHLPTVALYVLLAIASFAVMVRWHLSKRPEFVNFTLMDAIAEAGRFSIERTAKSCALVVTSVGFVHLVACDKLTEWYFGIYAAAWISADFIKRREEPRPG
jgi:hypothetical protein